MIPFKSILVPVDFSDTGKVVLDTATALAKRDGAKLTLVHVWELPAYAYATLEFTPSDLFTPLREAAQAQLDATVEAVKKAHPETVGVVKHGTPWREIVRVVDDLRPDLVVMGTHGRRGVERMVLGSVAEKVVRMSSAPVLTLGAGGQ
jgi:nucleotide-binding universal stress UspA family protein